MSKKNDYRRIRNHIAQCHQVSQSRPQDTTAVGSDQSPTENETRKELDNYEDDTFFDGNDSCRDLEDNEIEGIVNQLDMEDNDNDDDFGTTYQPPKSGKITVELEDFTVFSNETSNVYFW